MKIDLSKHHTQIMKRLGIFVFYDNEGIVDAHVEYLLGALKERLEKLVITVNGSVSDSSYRKLKKFSSQIFIRPNIGLDAGAYKDTFLDFLNEEEWLSYDEIVLCNDTFFGPITPLQDVWKKLENVEADFWGITRHPGGKFEDNTEFPGHIQTYFLVLRKSLIRSSCFKLFWENLSYPETHRQAVEEFEIDFTNYFAQRGLYGTTLMDVCDCDFALNYGINPYVYYNYELIKNFKIPFLKKKCLEFDSSCYLRTMDLLMYIDDKTNYDVKLINDHILRLYSNRNKTILFDYNEIENFYNSHNKIYVYGAGKIGAKIQKYFSYRKWNIEAILVSEVDGDDKNIRKYGTIAFQQSDGIIMALGRKNLREVLEKVSADFQSEDILLPNYGLKMN